jgi:hypothetical protein
MTVSAGRISGSLTYSTEMGNFPASFMPADSSRLAEMTPWRAAGKALRSPSTKGVAARRTLTMTTSSRPVIRVPVVSVSGVRTPTSSVGIHWSAIS